MNAHEKSTQKCAVVYAAREDVRFRICYPLYIGFPIAGNAISISGRAFGRHPLKDLPDCTQAVRNFFT